MGGRAGGATTGILAPAKAIHLAAAGISLIAVCYGLARFAYGLFVPAFRNTFDLDATAAGAIASGSYVAYCVGVLLATAVTPRAGARVVALAAGLLATVGTSVIAMAPDVVMLAVGVIIAGSSTGVASPPLVHAIARRVSPEVRDRTQTIVNAGTGLGVMVSGPIALLAQDQWRVAWFAFAGVAAVVTLWSAIAVPAARDAAGESSPGAERTRHRRLPRGLLRLAAASATMGVASAAGWTFGQDLLTTEGGHTSPFATIAWIVLGACGLLGAAAGDMAERLGLGRSWVLLMIALGGSLAALAAASQSAIVAIAASAVFGAVYIALTGLLLVWSTRVFASDPARGVGVVFLVLALGQAGAAPLLGIASDLSGSVAAAFWIAAAVALLGALMRPARG
ncbi:putative MFS family arabinose efflux permease [Microbacterium ginsengiterrae]|uniref:Putative MFS family arabinose efflux permease n=1 Tax=Microbacterium ginsengiterrae TaxID=546115 RepID=A0A7W9CD14_9MICO|nr:YbfB/YjiJ family MFS transporter [Microbacterium ginsengiterrae]MBB5743345.1 putative MFS family arabinose efflux permease [Microbacterium ginsengiterrae]